MRRLLPSGVTGIVAVALLSLAAASTAIAYFTTMGAGASNPAVVSTIAQPTISAATAASGGTVALTWSAITAPGSGTVTYTVSRNGEEVKLTPLEFDLLVALARKPRQVFTREVLLEQVWGYRHAADTRLVNVHVQRLRAKIEPDPERPEIILTVRGVGYKAGTG